MKNLQIAYDKIHQAMEDRLAVVSQFRGEASEALENGDTDLWHHMSNLAHMEGSKVQGLERALAIVHQCLMDEIKGND